MKFHEPYLIVDLNDNNIILFIVSFNEKKEFEVIKKIILNSQGIINGRIIDIESVSQLIKKEVNKIEEDIDFLLDIKLVTNKKWKS